jgi:hypothetical protein
VDEVTDVGTGHGREADTPVLWAGGNVLIRRCLCGR